MESSVVRGGKEEECTEIATFYIGRRWFGIRSHEVMEAVDVQGITAAPGAPRFIKGYMIYQDRTILVVDLRSLLPGEPAPTTTGSAQVAVLRLSKNNEYLGLLVDELGEIPELPNHRIEKLSSCFTGEGLGESIVKHEAGREANHGMLIILSPEAICRKLVEFRNREQNGGNDKLPPMPCDRPGKLVMKIPPGEQR